MLCERYGRVVGAPTCYGYTKFLETREAGYASRKRRNWGAPRKADPKRNESREGCEMLDNPDFLEK